MNVNCEKLTTDADYILSSASTTSISHSIQTIDTKNLQHNLGIIQELELEDLNGIEKDLEFYDKVSIIFLICGHDKTYAKIAVQHLIIAEHSTDNNTNLLFNWLQKIDNWKDCLLESLCIIQAKYILVKMGLNLDELYIRYLPEIIETNLYIHPVLKGLYKMCEQFELQQTEKFIEYMKSKYSVVDEFPYKNYNYLEISILNWIGESIIDIGEWRPTTTSTENNNETSSSGTTNRLEFCNIEPIKEYLKENNIYPLCEQLKNISIRLNFTSNNCITKDKSPKKKTKPLCVKPIKTQQEKLTNAKDFNCENQIKTTLNQNSNNNNNNDNNNISGNHFKEAKSIDATTNKKTLSSDRYLIRRDRIGYALIINQVEFIKSDNLTVQLSTRQGSDKDNISLCQTFSSFGYDVLNEQNLTSYDILIKIKDVVNRSADKDSLVVCILSHGHEGVIYGSDSESVKIKAIEQLILSERLLNKPKILIVQACQGETIQKAVKHMNKLEYDGPPLSIISTPKYIDLIVAKSTIAGFASIRHIDKGTWFIQTLCKKLNELSDSEHFVDILTTVCNDISMKRGADDQCMSPWFEMNFRKKLYFSK